MGEIRKSKIDLSKLEFRQTAWRVIQIARPMWGRGYAVAVLIRYVKPC